MQAAICLVLACHMDTLLLTAELVVALTCQRSDLDLVSIGDSIEVEKDLLLEKVCFTFRWARNEGQMVHAVGHFSRCTHRDCGDRSSLFQNPPRSR